MIDESAKFAKLANEIMHGESLPKTPAKIDEVIGYLKTFKPVDGTKGDAYTNHWKVGKYELAREILKMLEV